MVTPAVVNPLDPVVHPDRDLCVDRVRRALWRACAERGDSSLHGLGPRSVTVAEMGLSALYDYNAHPDTPPSDRLGVLDLLPLLDGDGAGFSILPFREWVLSRVSDPRTLRWFQTFASWPDSARSEACSILRARLVRIATLDLGPYFVED